MTLYKHIYWLFCSYALKDNCTLHLFIKLCTQHRDLEHYCHPFFFFFSQTQYTDLVEGC